jgi:serine/threonine-protein kinase HipA
MTKELQVVLDDDSLAPPETVVGTLFRERERGHEVVSFAYDLAYLATPSPIEIDPELPLHPGRLYAPPGRLFGVFRDCSPDRWGRVLMERREAIEAKQEGRKQHRLSEWDFLAGVDDSTRQGAIRLRRTDGPREYTDDRARSVPPFSRLRDLQDMANKLEQHEDDDAHELAQWLSQLVAPGSSLGGTRPKASFLEEDGSLWIAKFPSNEDRYDQGAWEHLASVLARRAGILMPESRLVRLGPRHRTFTAKRFDREAGSRRLYASAMSLLCRDDGEQASYLEIAEALQLRGAADRIAEQLAHLYRRIAFSVLVGNRDDHLRNHGFLREAKGWVLSPAFDINPNPDKTDHALTIDEADPTPSVRSLRATREYYRLTEERARAIEGEVRAAVRPWAEVAEGIGIPRAEIQRLAAVLDADRE